MATDNTPAWWVEAQRETTQVNGAGKLTTGVELTYSTRGGHTGTLFVTDAEYTDLGRVKDQLAAAAAHADNVGTLTADTPVGG